jgi:hypothetical protein
MLTPRPWGDSSGSKRDKREFQVHQTKLFWFDIAGFIFLPLSVPIPFHISCWFLSEIPVTPGSPQCREENSLLLNTILSYHRLFRNRF